MKSCEHKIIYLINDIKSCKNVLTTLKTNKINQNYNDSFAHDLFAVLNTSF